MRLAVEEYFYCQRIATKLEENFNLSDDCKSMKL